MCQGPEMPEPRLSKKTGFRLLSPINQTMLLKRGILAVQASRFLSQSVPITSSSENSPNTSAALYAPTYWRSSRAR